MGGLGLPLGELPRGVPRKAYSCPIAMGLRAGTPRCVQVDTAFVSLAAQFDCSVRTPPNVAEFIRRFDEGRYPELVE